MDCSPSITRCFRLGLAAAAFAGGAIAGPAAADIRVVASIKPVHSLVSAVMAGVGKPHLLMRGKASPHSFTMRPSDAAALQEANVVFLIDEAMETTLGRAIADTLSQADPTNAAKYKANARALLPRLDALTAQISAAVAPVRGKPFVVFHDGYRYFEDRFGLNAVGSMVVSPGRSPGAKRLRQLRAKIRELGVACVFAEPQFDKRIVNVVVEGTKVRPGTADPLGAAIKDGPELYFTLLRNMAAAFTDCLSPAA